MLIHQQQGVYKPEFSRITISCIDVFAGRREEYKLCLLQAMIVMVAHDDHNASHTTVIYSRTGHLSVTAKAKTCYLCDTFLSSPCRQKACMRSG